MQMQVCGVLRVLGWSRGFGGVQRCVPKPMIRGIQVCSQGLGLGFGVRNDKQPLLNPISMHCQCCLLPRHSPEVSARGFGVPSRAHDGLHLLHPQCG